MSRVRHRPHVTAPAGIARFLTAVLAAGVVVVQGIGVCALPAEAAATITVTNCNSSGAGSLPAAIAMANTDAGPVIDFALSPACSTITVSSTLVITEDMTIDGPGASTLAVSGGGTVEVLSVSASAPVAISGLTIESGMTAPAASSAADGGSGGGIYNTGNLTLANVTVSGNATGGYSAAGGGGGVGGGIYNAGTLTLANSTVAGNTTGVSELGHNGGAGAGIYNSGTLNLTNSTISANTTGASVANPIGGSDSGGNGGGIYNTGTLNLTSSTVSGNTIGVTDSGPMGTGASGGSGGGIYNAGSLDLKNSTISGNTTGAGATGTAGGPGPNCPDPSGICPAGQGGFGGFGGGVYNNGNLILTDTTIAANTTGAGGTGGNGFGAGNGPGGPGGSGGGIYNDGVNGITSTLTLTNSTLSGNATGAGGSGSPAGAVGPGGGIDNDYASVTVSSSILAGTTTAGTLNTPDNCGGAVPSNGGYNVEDGTSCGFGSSNGSLSSQTDTAIGLAPLGQNGGATDTEAIGTSSVAYHLVPMSSGLCLATDQRGGFRPQPPNSAACDAGAYEYGASPQVINFISQLPAAAVAGGPSYSPSASAGASGNPVVFSIDAGATSVCSISGGVVSFGAVGTCVIDANQAGTSVYSAAAQAQQAFSVGRGSQAITFTSPAPSAVFGGPSYTPSASGGASGNPVVISIDASAASVCSISAGVVSFEAAGTCVVDANEAGTTNYSAAPQAQQAFSVGKGSQAITFTSPAPNAVFGGPRYTPSASGGASGNLVVLSIDATAASVCSISGRVVGFTGVGLCLIDANQAGTTNYAAAPQAQQGFVVVSASSSTKLTLSATSVPYGHEQVLTFKVVVSPQFSGKPAGKLTIVAGKTTLCSVTTSTGVGSCSIPSRSATLLPVGSHVVTATYSGSQDFRASTSVASTFVVSKATSKTGLTLSAQSVIHGHEQTLKFTVTLSPLFAGIPTGTVTVVAGKTKLCSIDFTTASHGKGTCSPSASALAVGTYSVTADFGGGTEFASSVSNPVTLKVT